jgi:maleylacetate reductase
MLDAMIWVRHPNRSPEGGTRMRLPSQGWRAGFTLTIETLDGMPVLVTFGIASLGQVPGVARTLGQRALLVTGRHQQAAADLVSAELGADVVGQMQEAAEHVPIEVATTAVAQARALQAEVLIAIGGGSATGLAKAVALETGLPILAVPTTYAGSEMTSIWGVTSRNRKATGRDARVRPRAIIYDPALTLSLPPQMTAASGMNAMAHAIEALYAPDVTPKLTEVALAAITAVTTALPVAVARPDDLAARTELLYGAWLAGWALGSTTMGLHHKLAHVLGGTYRLPHAGVHSVLLPHVAAYNAPTARAALARAAIALGSEGPDDIGAALFDLAARIGAPTSLAELGLAHGQINEVAASVDVSNIINPREVTEPGLVRLLQAAYSGTRPLARASTGEPEDPQP